jgi:hypothetical protein
LSYEVTVSGVPDEVFGVSIHRAQTAREGGVIYRISGPTKLVSSGVITLSAAERTALGEGELYVRLYTAQRPAGGGAAPILVP